MPGARARNKKKWRATQARVHVAGGLARLSSNQNKRRGAPAHMHARCMPAHAHTRTDRRAPMNSPTALRIGIGADTRDCCSRCSPDRDETPFCSNSSFSRARYDDKLFFPRRKALFISRSDWQRLGHDDSGLGTKPTSHESAAHTHTTGARAHAWSRSHAPMIVMICETKAAVYGGAIISSTPRMKYRIRACRAMRCGAVRYGAHVGVYACMRVHACTGASTRRCKGPAAQDIEGGYSTSALSNR